MFEIRNKEKYDGLPIPGVGQTCVNFLVKKHDIKMTYLPERFNLTDLFRKNISSTSINNLRMMFLFCHLLNFKKATNFNTYRTSGHSSVVERLVANEKVVGSSPIARSKIMIIWIASYPKSGNTYLRSFISSYYFSKKGKFDFDLLLNILQFPSVKFVKKKIKSESEASQNWIYNQQNFFSGDKIHFLKTHSSLNQYKGNSFTTKNLSLGAIYIVRDPRNIITSMTHHYLSLIHI